MVCEFANHLLSVIQEHHEQPNESAADHPPAWSVSSCQQCGTLFVVYYAVTDQLLQGYTLCAMMHSGVH